MHHYYAKVKNLSNLLTFIEFLFIKKVYKIYKLLKLFDIAHLLLNVLCYPELSIYPLAPPKNLNLMQKIYSMYINKQFENLKVIKLQNAYAHYYLYIIYYIHSQMINKLTCLSLFSLYMNL